MEGRISRSLRLRLSCTFNTAGRATIYPRCIAAYRRKIRMAEGPCRSGRINGLQSGKFPMMLQRGPSIIRRQPGIVSAGQPNGHHRGRAVLGDDRSVIEARGPSRGKHRGILMTSPLRLAILMLILAACSCSRSTSSAPSADTLQAAAKPDVPVQRLDLTYEKPVVGGKVRAVASNLPAGKTVDLKWSTVTGGWVIEDYYYFRGKKYSETTSSLGKFPVNSNGRLNASFTIPEHYGSFQ